MKYLHFVVTLTVLSFFGCGTAPITKYSSAKHYFSAIPKNNARVYFYRTDSVGALLKPDIRVNDKVVGEAVVGQYFFKDVRSGSIKISTSTEVTNEIQVKLKPREEIFVKINMYFGIMAGRAEPVVVKRSEALKDLNDLEFAGPNAEKIEEKIRAKERSNGNK